MKLRIDITAKEIKEWQKEYAKACANPDGRCRPRLTERHWIAREIAAALPSGASSQKGQWAVDATLKPLAEEALLRVPEYRAAADEEKRQAEEQRRAREEKATKLRQEAEQRMQPVTDHLRDCSQCEILVNEDHGYPTMQYSGWNFRGQVCAVGYDLIRPLVDSRTIHWRGHGLKAPITAVPQDGGLNQRLELFLQ